jgi:hypothetical protein
VLTTSFGGGGFAGNLENCRTGGWGYQGELFSISCSSCARLLLAVFVLG